MGINAIIIYGENLMKNRKLLLVIIAIVTLVLIIGIVLIFSLDKELEGVQNEVNIDKEQLEVDFNSIFDNEENEYVNTMYNLDEEKSGSYKIRTNIPFVFINSEIDNKINKEINDTFISKLLEIINESENFTIMNIDYATSVNNDIVSLAIKCVLKEGSNAQRTIIKTYNYDIVNQREVSIMELVPEGQSRNIQKQIDTEIAEQIRREEAIVGQGYNVYRRDKDSDIYVLENATEFYVKDNALYIIYCYGNSNYTSEVDLIINAI